MSNNTDLIDCTFVDKIKKLQISFNVYNNSDDTSICNKYNSNYKILAEKYKNLTDFYNNHLTEYKNKMDEIKEYYDVD